MSQTCYALFLPFQAERTTTSATPKCSNSSLHYINLHHFDSLLFKRYPLAYEYHLDCLQNNMLLRKRMKSKISKEKTVTNIVFATV